ncbi:MAG: c-type cytochrome [Rubrivivax sp.]
MSNSAERSGRRSALCWGRWTRALGGALAALALATAGAPALAAEAFPGIGRAATPAEVAAWDIDVRPDFKGLPRGAGSVAQGMVVWESKCASCHGVFGESNEVFTPLVGGTTAADVQRGRVARLTDDGFPGRTTLMKVATVSTLWDYIHRAMPWNAPKSLSPDEVYAVTAFLLNLGGVLPDDYVMSDKNIAEVQERMPNRHGMSTAHAMWPGAAFGQRSPDVKATACMKDCRPEPRLASVLPEFARNAHGNLAEQNRLVGPQRGADPTRPAPTRPAAAVAATAAPSLATAAAANPRPAAPAQPADNSGLLPAPTALLQKHQCLACHGMDRKVVGPGFNEVARKHAGRADAEAYLAQKVVAGGAGVWGTIPMPPQSLPLADAQAIAKWMAQGAKR